MDTIKSTANMLLAIPLTLLAIIFALEKLGYLSADNIQLARILSLIMFGLGIVIYIFWGAVKLWGTTEYSFHIHRMKPSQMDFSIKISNKLFPVIPTKRELKCIYKVNNAVCKLQYRIIKFLGLDVAKYTGICSIVPMTDKAKALLEAENLNGLTFTPEHISKPRQEHTCLYIGSVGAIGARAKKHILIFLEGVIDSEFGKGIDVVFTRPTTKNGLRIAKRFGFIPVMDDAGEDELNRLYRIYKTEYDEIHS